MFRAAAMLCFAVASIRGSAAAECDFVRDRSVPYQITYFKKTLENGSVQNIKGIAQVYRHPNGVVMSYEALGKPYAELKSVMKNSFSLSQWRWSEKYETWIPELLMAYIPRTAVDHPPTGDIEFEIETSANERIHVARRMTGNGSTTLDGCPLDFMNITSRSEIKRQNGSAVYEATLQYSSDLGMALASHSEYRVDGQLMTSVDLTPAGITGAFSRMDHSQD